MQLPLHIGKCTHTCMLPCSSKQLTELYLSTTYYTHCCCFNRLLIKKHVLLVKDIGHFLSDKVGRGKEKEEREEEENRREWDRRKIREWLRYSQAFVCGTLSRVRSFCLLSVSSVRKIPPSLKSSSSEPAGPTPPTMTTLSPTCLSLCVCSNLKWFGTGIGGSIVIEQVLFFIPAFRVGNGSGNGRDYGASKVHYYSL